ncbi:hypothetical protein EDB86DRAFT_2902394 [Lactarius hatsudake]|nr:hypothetical protein EDB86DRAFT_2902394 [Lactarius hatsudake]
MQWCLAFAIPRVNISATLQQLPCSLLIASLRCGVRQSFAIHIFHIWGIQPYLSNSGATSKFQGSPIPPPHNGICAVLK